jgi:16S rRNA (adenine1518-N6/adenine1519-N6)-dimethyltransferase
VPTTSTASSSLRETSGRGVGRAPCDPRTIEATLREVGVRPSRRLGQSFLSDPFVADAEAALVGPSTGAVVEIGGGLGVLTEALLRRGVTPLTVLERDPRLAAHLRRTFGSEAEVLTRDAFDHPWQGVAVAVGNLPFSIATMILIRLFESRVPRIVALVQREVARRIGASPGGKEYGRLSILASLYGQVELFRTVPAAAFVPLPAVDGQIVVHTARDGPLPVPSVERFESIIRRLFSQRRKKLGNLMPKVLPDGFDLAQVVSGAGWPEDWADRRPETIAPDAYFRLAAAMEK